MPSRPELHDAAATPLVSVVVIFFNAERFLDEAIESIFAQTESRWELLLVDDGSTDTSRDIAQRHVDRAPDRVRLLQHEGGQNLGMSASRNRGVEHARGTWVAFLDADDVWLPDKLEHQLDVLRRHPQAEMVYGPTEFWHAWTGAEADRGRDTTTDLQVETGVLLQPPYLMRRSLETDGGMVPGICSVMARRERILQVGAFEPRFRACYEDQVFLSKMFVHAPAVVTDRVTDRYRQHPDSCCAKAISEGDYDPDRPHPARQRYLTWLEGYLAEHGVDDAALLQALERNLLPYRHPVRWVLGRAAEQVHVRGRRVLRKTTRRLLGNAYPAFERRATTAATTARLWLDARRSSDANGPTIEQHYLQRFLASHAEHITGRVLTIGPARRPRLESGEVATAADLAATATRPDAAFDCIIVTGDDVARFDADAAARLHRLLAPAGIALLATSPTDAREIDAIADRMHDALANAFPAELVQHATFGNRWAAAARRRGLTASHVAPERLAVQDPDHAVLLGVRVEKPTADYLQRMAGRWNHEQVREQPYGDDTTYQRAIAWLDGHGVIEDWGCGPGLAKRFVTESRYVGVDGSRSPAATKVVDLRTYRTEVDCILIRHVLEHNHDWERLLANAVASFRRRMALVLFTPWAEQTREITQWSGIPDLSLCRDDVVRHFGPGVRWREETLTTDSQYGVEHVFYLER